MKNIFPLIAFLILAIQSPSFSDGDFLWFQVSGNWIIETDNANLIDLKTKGYEFNYTDLINNNSILSVKLIPPFSEITSDFEIFNPVSQNQTTIVFSASKSLLSYYGVRFSGPKTGINKISIVQSKPKDTTLPPSAKNNFEVTELAAVDADITFNSPIQCKIRMDQKKLQVFVNGKSVISKDFTEELSTGRIGFSHRNNLIRIRSISVYKDKEVLFTDDFKTNKIEKYTVKAVPDKK